MRKIFLSTFALLCFTFLGAQTYFGVSYSPSLPIMKYLIASDFYGGSSGFALFNGMYGSFGGGSSVGGVIGYRFQSGLIAEVNVEQFNGSGLSYDFYDSTAAPYIRHVHRDAHLDELKITPQLGYAVGKNKISGWFRSGLIIGCNTVMTMNYSETDNSDSYFRSTKYDGNCAFGFRQSAGVSYDFFKGLTATFEVFGNFRSWSPRESVTTKNEHNGVEQGSQHYVYVDSFIEPNLNAAPDDPALRLRTTYSLSSLGAKFSVTYNIRFATKSGKVI